MKWEDFVWIWVQNNTEESVAEKKIAQVFTITVAEDLHE